jgi:hypothetical protein
VGFGDAGIIEMNRSGDEPADEISVGGDHA